MARFLFYLMAVAILVLGYYAIYVRFIKGEKGKGRRILFFLFAILGTLPSFLFRGLSYQFPLFPWSKLMFTHYIVFGFWVYLVYLLIFVGFPLDFCRRFWKVLTQKRINRLVILLACLFTAAAFWGAQRELAIKKVSLKSDVLHGLRIVQLSDIHIGHSLRQEFVESIVRKVKELKPHLLIITGDLVDAPSSVILNDFEAFKSLKPELGIWAVLGNHEYYSGLEDWKKSFPSLGIKLLINEHAVIRFQEKNILLAGVTDMRDPLDFPDLEKAMKDAPPFDYGIFLNHRPDMYREAEAKGFNLQLSGHTHGGQFFPATLFVHLAHDFVSGLYDYKRMKIYVSEGTGYWGPPMRLGTRSEITLFQLD